MLKGGAKHLKWKPEGIEAFEVAKRTIGEAGPLHRPDFELPFVLQTDASQEGMSGVLYQETATGERRIVSFASAKFNKAQRKYHVNEQECFALVWAIKKYRGFLSDKKFTVRTDSRALTWLNRFKDSKAKLTRWALLLQEYVFDIEHVPGSLNQLPDLLSRDPDSNVQVDSPDESRLVPPEGAPKRGADMKGSINGNMALINVVEFDSLYEEIARKQQTSTFIRRTMENVKNLEGKSELDRVEQKLWNQFAVEDNLLWRKEKDGYRMVVPKKMIPKILYFFHDSEEAGHPGIEETTRKIEEFYFWGWIRTSVQTHVKKCTICAVMKSQQRQQGAPLRPRIPKYPFEMLSIDVLGPYPESALNKNRFIVVIQDVFSKWVEAIPAKEVLGKDVVRILEREIVSRYGPPKIIVSDNGTAFKSKTMEKYCKKIGAEQAFTAVYHQRANPVERRVQELKKVLRILLHGLRETMWEEKLPDALRILRGRRNRATGETPASIVLGYELPIPGEWKTKFTQRRRNKGVRDRQRKNKIIFKRTLDFQGKEYPSRSRRAPVVFLPGDKVTARARAQGAFAPRWLGPGEIIRRTGETTYDVKIGRKPTNFHVDDLRPAPAGNENPDSTEENTESESEESDWEFGTDLRRTEEPVEDTNSEDEALLRPEIVFEEEEEQDNPEKTLALKLLEESRDRVDLLRLDILRCSNMDNELVKLQFEERLTQELLKLDEIENPRSLRVRIERKRIVKEIEAASDQLASWEE